MKKIEMDDPLLLYSGRIDFEDPKAPSFLYPASFVRMRFIGTEVKVELTNYHEYWDNYLGVILDGEQKKIKLRSDGESRKEMITLAEGLAEGVHELMVFKRQDACHRYVLHGLELSDGGRLLAQEPLPERRIEVYGDSVSAGEVSEAVDYVGKPDPQHSGEPSNSYYSYAWFTARMLKAQLHNIAQGGIALMDGTGWFHEPQRPGMESVYDKLQYNERVGICKPWDFSRYTPNVVIVALGQNDNHPDDYMAEDYSGDRARAWRSHYRRFIQTLRGTYPKAQIILTTTILGHEKAWDDAIDEVCISLGDPRVHHFLYTNNGCGTPGHIRIPEAEKMAEELSAYIEQLEQVWDA